MVRPGPTFSCKLSVRWVGLVLLLLMLLSGPLLATEVESRSSVEHETVIALIDQQIRTAWQENGLRPARRATEAQWCRRVYLDLLGRVPTVAELDDYLALKSRDKHRELVDRLLGSEYVAAFADHWTAIWTNTLIGRTGGRNRRALTSREGMAAYLRAALLENKPYDHLASELITAVGSASPEQEGYNGAVNFLIEKLDEGGIQATAKTAEIFLGTAVQCTQCHNHPVQRISSKPVLGTQRLLPTNTRPTRNGAQ